MDEALIQAAGGVVERHDDDGVKVAVIFRERRGDWGFPKGKLKAEETAGEAALREVREETGCEVEALRFAGCTNYFHGDKPKVVYFWRMALVKESTFQPNDEVEKLEWLSPRVALGRLTHAEDRALLERLFRRESRPTLREFFARTCKWLGQLTSRRRWQRLASEIAVCKLEQTHREQCTGEGAPAGWYESAKRAIGLAELALEEGDIDLGWKCLQAARRFELATLHGEELEGQVKSLRNEAEKLSNWRQRTTEQLLGTLDNPIKATVSEVVIVAELRDGHFANQAYKDALARRFLMWIGSLLLGVVIALFALTVWDKLPIQAKTDQLDAWMFLSVVLFGLLGGSLSAALRAPQFMTVSRIPEMITTFHVTLLRLTMSAAAALAIYCFLNSQFRDAFNLDVLKNVTPYTVFVMSFVAGFSERLVLRAVEYVVGKRVKK